MMIFEGFIPEFFTHRVMPSSTLSVNALSSGAALTMSILGLAGSSALTVARKPLSVVNRSSP